MLYLLANISPNGTSHDMVSVEPVLASRVETPVITVIIVPVHRQAHKRKIKQNVELSRRVRGQGQTRAFWLMCRMMETHTAMTAQKLLRMVFN